MTPKEHPTTPKNKSEMLKCRPRVPHSENQKGAQADAGGSFGVLVFVFVAQVVFGC